jgi:F-type H+-transporting ATPase subunit delta
LTPDELKAISAAVEKASNVQVELVNELDPALLGGVRVVVGATVYDSSIKSKIDSLKYELLEGKR